MEVSTVQSIGHYGIQPACNDLWETTFRRKPGILWKQCLCNSWLGRHFGPKTGTFLMVMRHVSFYRFDDALPGEDARQPLGETQVKPQVKETGATASQSGLKSAIKKNTGETKRVKVGVRTDEGIEGTQPALLKTKPRLKFEGDDESDIPADGALPCCRPSDDY